MSTNFVVMLLLVFNMLIVTRAEACIATPPRQPDVMFPMPRDLPKRLRVVAGTQITFALPHLDSVRVETTEGIWVRSKRGDGQLVIATDPYRSGLEATLVVEYRHEKRTTIVELQRWVPPPVPPVVIDLTTGREAHDQTVGLMARTELEIRVLSEDGLVDVQFGELAWLPQWKYFDVKERIFTGVYNISGIDRSGGERLDYGGEVEVTVRARADGEQLQRLRVRPMPTPVC